MLTSRASIQKPRLSNIEPMSGKRAPVGRWTVPLKNGLERRCGAATVESTAIKNFRAYPAFGKRARRSALDNR
jgi:hypothetical protein